MDAKKKIEQLQSFTRENEGKEMTTNTGVKISNDENSLTAGDRGPTLLEDFLMRENFLTLTVNEFQNESFTHEDTEHMAF